MSNAALKGMGRPLTAVAVALVVMLFGASSALAAVSATPNTRLSDTTPTRIAVTGSGFARSTDFDTGICSKAAYGIYGIPACGPLTTVRSDGNGDISASVTVSKTSNNQHVFIPAPYRNGQPTTFTCAGDVLLEDECHIVIATHSSPPTVLGGADVSFLP